MSVHYIRNALGTVHAADDAHLEKILGKPGETGIRVLPAGWSEITEQEAKEARPQLFGAADPTIKLTDEELIRALDREEKLAELAKRRAANLKKL